MSPMLAYRNKITPFCVKQNTRDIGLLNKGCKCHAAGTCIPGETKGFCRAATIGGHGRLRPAARRGCQANCYAFLHATRRPFRPDQEQKAASKERWQAQAAPSLRLPDSPALRHEQAFESRCRHPESR